MTAYQEHIQLSRACALWNSHTNPAAFRTDWEHECHRKAARKILNYIRRNYRPAQVRELSNGSLWPVEIY